MTRFLIISLIVLIPAGACSGGTVQDGAVVHVTSTPTSPPARTLPPTTPTAQPTATPETVEAEPSAPPLGDVVLETSMEDWEPYEGEGTALFWDQGSYHLRVDELSEEWNWNSAYAQTYVAAFGNVSVSIDVRNISAAGYSEGCLITRSDPLGVTHFSYVLCLNTFENATQAWYEQIACDGEWRQDILVEYTTSDAIKPADEWNTLKIVSRNYQHWFYINDQLLGVAEHVGPLAGSIGLLIHAYDLAPAEWEFRNLTVLVAEGGEATFARPDPAPDIFNRRCEDNLS
jgi:hypothetical protein